MQDEQLSLEELEAEARELDTGAAELSRWLESVAGFSLEHLAEIRELPAYLGVSERPALRGPLPAAPQPFGAVLDRFRREILSEGILTTSGGFMGYVPGGGLATAAIADYLAALTNRYSGVYMASPGAVEVENTAVDWLRQIVGFGPDAWGTLQSGGSLATLTAFVAARETRPPERWSQSVIYATAECHLCVRKALHTAGLGGLPLRLVAVDDEYRMLPDRLAEQVRADEQAGLSPWIVVAGAGTINTGAVDPLDAIADICAAHDLWFHIDAAYGGFFVLAPTTQLLLAGMARADSVVLDPHKGLFLPYGCGAVLVKDGELLRQGFAIDSDYLADVRGEDCSSPADYSAELTRHFRGLRLWMSLEVHGLGRFRAALEEKIQLAGLAHAGLENTAGIDVGPTPQLSCVTFRARGGDGPTADLLGGLQRRGKVHLSSTRLAGDLYLRMCILCHRTHQEHVETAIEEIRELLG